MRACRPHRDVGNLRRLGRHPAGIEAIVRGHGHVNHAAGLSGLPMPAGRAVIGGFHLTGPLIGDTVTAPGQLANRCDHPAADWKATYPTARLHGAFTQNSFGTAFQLPP
jgi:hypothetical protein